MTQLEKLTAILADYDNQNPALLFEIAALFGIGAPPAVKRKPFVIHLGTGLTNQGQGSDWV